MELRASRLGRVQLCAVPPLHRPGLVASGHIKPTLLAAFISQADAGSSGSWEDPGCCLKNGNYQRTKFSRWDVSGVEGVEKHRAICTESRSSLMTLVTALDSR